MIELDVAVVLIAGVVFVGLGLLVVAQLVESARERRANAAKFAAQLQDWAAERAQRRAVEIDDVLQLAGLRLSGLPAWLMGKAYLTHLWAGVPPALGMSDTDFARALLAQYNVTVLPGSYLAREANGSNPGAGRIRMALVAELDECVEAAQRIVAYTRSL